MPQRGSKPFSADQSEASVQVIAPSSNWRPIDWGELWANRELYYFLVRRDIVVRYKQTVLGAGWAILQPVFSMLVFTVIFGNFAKMPSDGIPYPLFVFAGLLPWLFFSGAVTGASQSLMNQQALLTKVYLPRLFIPASSLGGALADLLVSAIVFLALLVIFKVWPGPRALLIPLLMLIAACAALGAGLLLAALTVTYRDFRYVLPFLMQAWMYVSPVIYPVALVPEQFQWILAINPLTGVIDGTRSALFGREWNGLVLAMSTVSALTLLALGLYYFRATEKRFADVA